MRALVFLLFIFSLSASAQTGAGIYKIRWHVDKRLINKFMINEIPVGADGVGRLQIPAQLYDSVLNEVLFIVHDELRTEVALLYPINKDGEQISTASRMEQVGGLPRGTRKQAIKTEYKEYYVKFKIIVGVGQNNLLNFQNANVGYTRLRPFVRVKMKAYGVDRRLKFRKRIRKGGFKRINSVSVNLGGTTVTGSDAMSIEEVVDMVFQGLERFKEKVK